MAKTTLEAAVEEVKKYKFFNPKLRDTSYATGDIYDKQKVASFQHEWEIPCKPGERPYLQHIKFLSGKWPHLRLLADFMEVSTSPMRWKNLPSGKKNPGDRDERASRTNVTQLDYFASGEVLRETYQSSEALRKALDELVEEKKVEDKMAKEKKAEERTLEKKAEGQRTEETEAGETEIEEKEAEEKAAEQRNFRLFVVEDLSRDVIELLGAHLDIEPDFFREQIFDYTWYNTRDRFVDPPRLSIVNRRQRWLQLRFATARYFETPESFQKGFGESEKFNVLRRPEDDDNNKALWDKKGAVVGISRTRASFWMGSTDGPTKGTVGVLLVDPTIKAGFPLWYGYRNWEETPSMHETKAPDSPPRDSLFNDLVYWAQNTDAFKTSSATDPASNIHIPIQALLRLVCAEWLTLTEYIRTRLGQIEWEISFPEHFLGKDTSVDVALKKLHIWRRLVPLYREMLAETLQRVFHFPCHAPNLVNGGSGLGNIISKASGTAEGNNLPTNCQCPMHDSTSTKQGPINALRDDFARVLSYMEDYQDRIDRLTSVVTAIISIEDSRRGRDDNRNVSRLTWLATFFIPLSFVASLFSMQADIGTIRGTIKWYFAAALPLAVVSLGLALILAQPSVQRRFTRKQD